MQTFVVLLALSLTLAANASPFGSRIVGGSDAPAGKYPFQVSLWKPNPIAGIKFQCGGSIINELYILTAAHCVYGYRASEISVGVGSQLLNETVKFYKSEKLIGHVGFDMYNVNDDIALIRLAEKIVYTDKIQPIRLPTENFDEESYLLRGNYPLVLSGWGRLYHGGPRPNSLQEIELKVLGSSECRMAFAVTPKQICTLNKEGEGPCNGDSGGPLVVDGAQIGIVSYGRSPCAHGAPDVFTRVYSYLSWITENMNLE